MAYVALKPCRVAGQDFRIGESIPDGLIHPGNANNLVRMQLIAEAEAESGTTVETKETIIIPDATLSIFVRTESGDMELEPTDAGIQDVFTALIGTATDAETVIDRMDDEDALILLHMADSRKTVKAAAEARAKALSPAQTEA